MTIAGLAPTYRGRVTVPVLSKVQAGACADRVTVRLVSGQSPQAFADRTAELAHGFVLLKLVTLVPCQALQGLRRLLYEGWTQDRWCGRDGGCRLCGLGASSAHALGCNR